MKNNILYISFCMFFSVSATASELKAGWDETLIEKIAVTISAAMLHQVENEYDSRNKQENNSNLRPFPHDEAKASLDTMMRCIIKQASTQWSLIDFRKNEGRYLRPLIEEAYAGGVCKPTGVLSESMQVR